MFQSDFTAARGFCARAAKTVLPALALAAGLATASVSQAATVDIYLGSESYSSKNTSQFSGPSGANVYLTPQVYQANYGTTVANPKFNLLVFCVDIFHYSGTNLSYNYDDSQPLSTNSLNGFIGATLSTVGPFNQVDHVGRLVNYGAKLYAADSNSIVGSNRDKLAAVQGAIWKVVNPTLVQTVGGSDAAAISGMIANLSGVNYLTTIYNDVGGVSNKIHFLKESATSPKPYGTANSHQAFAIAGVPEPATWVMMIGGFGMAGAILRRAPRKAVFS